MKEQGEEEAKCVETIVTISETGLCLTCYHAIKDCTHCNKKLKQFANVIVGDYLVILKYNNDKLGILNNNYFFSHMRY